MRIVKLLSENFKRIRAVAIEPKADGSVTVIEGRNGVGKTSVLDSIGAALGGAKLAPAEPIRIGESQASITVDLGDLLVTRKFKRELLHLDGCPEVMGNGCTCGPTTRPWGPIRSTLTVENKDGSEHKAPQALLDKLVGGLTFDPLAFLTLDKKAKHETLRRLVGLDFSDLDQVQLTAAADRTAAKKQADRLVAELEGMPNYPEAPAEEASMVDLVAQLDDIAGQRQQAEQDERFANLAHEARRQAAARFNSANEVVAAIERELEQPVQRRLKIKQDEVALLQTFLVKIEAESDAALNTASASRATVPDETPVREAMQALERVDAQVRANAARAKKQKDIEAVQAEQLAANLRVQACGESRATQLAEAAYPVKGLGLSENGVMFDGLPFEQASAAQQLRASVAIGLALSPKLKVMLVRNGNQLDKASLAALAAQAAEAGAQVWMEWVSEGDGKAGIVIEDGTTL